MDFVIRFLVLVILTIGMFLFTPENQKKYNLWYMVCYFLIVGTIFLV